MNRKDILNKIKKIKKKYIIFFTLFLTLFFLLNQNTINGLEIPDIFLNLQNTNATFTTNYGVLNEEANENNNYRNYFSNRKGTTFNDYSDSVSLSNTVDYTNYFYQQQLYNYDNDSFYSTNGIYDGVYTFTNDVGSNPADWTTSEPANTNIEVINSYLEHKEVVELSDDSGSANARMYQTFTSGNQEYGSIEFWICNTDATKKIIVDIDDGVSNAILFYIVADKFYHYDGASLIILSGAPTPQDNKWYHIKFEFECGSNGYKGLSSDKYRIYIDGVNYGVYSLRNAVNYLNKFEYSTDVAYSLYDIYIDAIGYSWSNNYDIGNNILCGYNNLDTYSNVSQFHKIDDYSINSGSYGFTYYNNYYYVVYRLTNQVQKYDIDWNYVSTYNLPEIVADGRYALDIEFYAGKFYILAESWYIYVYTDVFIFYDALAFSYSIAPFPEGFTIVNGFMYCIGENLKTHVGKYAITEYSIAWITNIDVNNSYYYFNDIDFYNGYYYLIGRYTNDITVKVYDYDFNFLHNTSIGNLGFYDYYLDYHDDILIINRLGSAISSEYQIPIFSINKKMLIELYAYDLSSVLKGKIEVKQDGITYLNFNHSILQLSIDIYSYSGSFSIIPEYTKYFYIDLLNISSIEYDIHVFINTINVFESIMINFTIITDNINEIIYTNNFKDSASYQFKKFKLNDFSYYQDTTGIFNEYNLTYTNINSNFFQNDLLGLRTLYCNDLNQEFSEYIHFGRFNDDIDISDFIPIPPSKYDGSPPDNTAWSFYGVSVSVDYYENVSFTHFSYEYPIIRADLNVLYWYDYWMPDILPFTDNWLGNLLAGFLNILIFIGAWILYAIQFIIYIVFVFGFVDLLCYFIGCGILILLWNVVINALLFALIGLVEIAFTYLPPFIEWIIYNLLPLVIGWLIDIIAWIVAFIFSLFGANFTEMYNLVNSFLTQFFNFLYSIFLFIIEYIPQIITYLYVFIYLYPFIWLKEFYCSGKGWYNRKHEFTLMKNAYKYPIMMIMEKLGGSRFKRNES